MLVRFIIEFSNKNPSDLYFPFLLNSISLLPQKDGDELISAYFMLILTPVEYAPAGLILTLLIIIFSAAVPSIDNLFAILNCLPLPCISTPFFMVKEPVNET